MFIPLSTSRVRFGDETRKISQGSEERTRIELSEIKIKLHDTAEVLAHPQTEALGLLQILGGLPVARPPVAVDGERAAHVSAAPPLGRDTEAVLLEAGYTASEIAGLRESGVVG